MRLLGLEKAEGITTSRYMKDCCKENNILHAPHAERK